MVVIVRGNWRFRVAMAAAAGAGAAARRLRTARNALPRRARCTLGGSDAPVGGRRAQLGALIAASAAAGLATPQRAALAAAGEFTKVRAARGDSHSAWPAVGLWLRFLRMNPAL